MPVSKRTMSALDALGLLKSDPLTLLRTCLLSTAGGGRAAIMRTFYIQEDVSYRGIIQRPAKFFSKRSIGGQKFKITTTNFPNSLPFKAFNLPMIESDRTWGLNPLQGEIVITGKLSACTILINGNHAAHIQPKGKDESGKPLTGEKLAFYLKQNFGNCTIYGQDRQGYSQNATIVGVKNDGNWNFYAQEIALNQSTITNVVQLS